MTVWYNAVQCTTQYSTVQCDELHQLQLEVHTSPEKTSAHGPLADGL